MAADDKIRWQISMALPQNEVKRIMGEMKKQAHAELTKTLPLHFAGAKAEGKIPGKPSVQLQRVEEIGGKKYLFSLETFAKKVPHRSKETGKATLEDIDRGYRLSVKELRETTKKVLSEDAQRIRELKQKIKYQEKDVQKAEIEKFLLLDSRM